MGWANPTPAIFFNYKHKINKMRTVLIYIWMLTGTVLASGLNAQPTSKSTLLWEGFEQETFPPSGWTATDRNEDFRTWFRGQNINDPILPVHTGQGAAVNLSTVDDTYLAPNDWLITPKVAIPATGSSVLKFWVGINQANVGDMYGVYVSTTNTDVGTGASTGSFTFIKNEVVHTSPDIYYEVTVSLDNYAGQEIYIGFRHYNSWDGYMLLLDDVSVEHTALETPTFGGAASIDFGNIADTDTKQTTYTITNTGNADLEVSQLSASPELELSQLPATIGYNQSADVTVTLNSTEVGLYEGSFVLATNDPEHETVTVSVTANITSATASTYYYQDFENGNPEGWTHAGPLFELNTGTGVNNSTSYRASIINLSTPSFTTGAVEMGPAPQVSFMYKALNSDNTTPVTEGITLKLSVSDNNGATWTNVHTISPDSEQQHVPSADYATVSVDLSAYANSTCKIRLEVPGVRFGLFFGIFVDNVGIGTPPAKDLAAASVTGLEAPTAGQTAAYTVSVQNNGSAAQSSYTVRLMKEGGAQLGSQQGETIAPNQTKTFTFDWTPDAAGETFLYGEVALDGDENASNNITSNLVVTVLPEGMTAITLGTGTSSYYLPVNFYYSNSMTQTIYPANELGVNSGTISSISYYATADAPYTSPTVTFYIGETDSTDFESAQFIDETGMTKVFEGTLTLPQGNSKVDIPFDEPYSYSGGNIVIYAVKNDNAYSDNKMFYGTSTPGEYRSIEMYYDKKGEAKAPEDGYRNQTYPNITFYVNTSTMGQISGTVSDAGGVLEGVKVAIDGSPLFAMTDAEGKYEFTHLTPDEVTLRATMFGYHDATADVTIVAGVNKVIDITMTELPKVIVSGTVSRSDNSNPIEGAAITLAGFDDYETQTNAAGEYSIEGVYADNGYSITVTAAGYVDYEATVEVAGADITYSVPMNETPLPVDGVTAQAGAAGAEVAWWAPGSAPFVNTTYILDDSTMENAMGINAYTAGSIGNKFVNDDTGRIQSIDIFGMTNESSTRSVNIDVYNTDRELIASSEPFTLPDNGWINVPLFNAVEFSGDFYVMLKLSAEAGNARIGFDLNGPYASAGLSYMMTESAGWLALAELSSPYNLVFGIRANAQVNKTDKSYEAVPPVRHIMRKPHSAQPVSAMLDIPAAADVAATGNPAVRTNSGAPKAIVSYSVYRLQEGEQLDETAWTELSAAVADTSFTDAGWNSLEAGVYRYAVKTNYTNLVSAAAISNPLLKGMELEVTLNLTTNSGDPVSGARVQLINQDGDADHIYGQTANNGTVIFTQVWKGAYNMSVILEGFKPCNREVEVEEDMDIDVTLEEIIAKPYGLEVEVDGSSASFTWNLENPFFDDMESHDDFIIENIGEYTLIDGDNAPTYIIQYSAGIDYEFPNNGYTGSFIVMNPSQTVPAMTDMFTPHSGSKVLACMASDREFSQTNNEWLILPKVKIADGMILSFWAASVPSDYNLELLRICVSTTGTAQEDFVQVTNVLTVPDEWTFGSLDLSAYDGQEIYLAINCVSHNGMMLLIDDISVGFDYGETGKSGKSFTNSAVYLNDTEIGNTPETVYEFTSLANGTYTAGVKSVYTSGESEIVYSEPFEINVTPPQYTVTFAVTDKDSNPVEDATIVFSGTTLSGYTVEGVIAGEYDYVVSKEGYITATGSVEVINQDVTVPVELSTVGIDETTLTGVTVYGNENNVYIVNPANIVLKSVQILDVLGRVVYNANAAGSATIEVSNASGIYMVRLVSADARVLTAKVHLGK
jgi:hypothetical protein